MWSIQARMDKKVLLSGITIIEHVTEMKFLQQKCKNSEPCSQNFAPFYVR